MSEVSPRAGLQPVRDPTAHASAVVEPRNTGEIASFWGAEATFILVNPMVNGLHLGWFILDSGASGSTITGRGARDAGLDEIGTAMIQGTTATTVFKAHTLDLGHLRFTDLHLTGIDMHWASLVFGRDIAGILGRNVFESAIVVIDGPGRSVSLLDPATEPMQEGIEWLPLTMLRGLPHVRARYGNAGEGAFVLDTGADATVHFFESAVDRHALLEAAGVRLERTKTQITFGSQGRIDEGSIEDFTLGSVQFGPLTATFARRNDAPSKYLEGVDGIIGMGLMRACVVIIDEPRQRVAFVQPRAPAH